MTKQNTFKKIRIFGFLALSICCAFLLLKIHAENSKIPYHEETIPVRKSDNLEEPYSLNSIIYQEYHHCVFTDLYDTITKPFER